MTQPANSYQAAGVDIDRAHDLLAAVKQKIASTRRPEMLTGIGGFGGLFQLDLSRYREPVLVSSMDGVGTKLMVASMTGDHCTVGADLVNHCINDIAVQGAEPLYFMDYLGIGKLRSPLYEDVLNGMADACLAQEVAMLGGETAEMPGMYGNDYDIVGCITGVVEKSELITGDQAAAGDVVVGLASSGLHTNGYSLARMVLFAQSRFAVDTELSELGETVGEALMKPHLCYWPVLRQLAAENIAVHALAHITGGGFYDNLPRVLPNEVHAELRCEVLSVPPIFGLIQQRGNISGHEMYRVFNMGVGMMVVVPAEAAEATIEAAAKAGSEAAVIGKIVTGAGPVVVDGVD